MNQQERRLVTRGQIVALREMGLSTRGIAERLAISRSTVSRWTRWEDAGNLNDLRKFLLLYTVKAQLSGLYGVRPCPDIVLSG